MNNANRITGTAIIRDTGVKADEGRKIIMMVALIAVPENIDLKSDHQYVTLGSANDVTGFSLNLLPGMEKDLTVQLRGMTPNCMVTSPIWRY